MGFFQNSGAVPFDILVERVVKRLALHSGTFRSDLDMICNAVSNIKKSKDIGLESVEGNVLVVKIAENRVKVGLFNEMTGQGDVTAVEAYVAGIKAFEAAAARELVGGMLAAYFSAVISERNLVEEARKPILLQRPADKGRHYIVTGNTCW